ncbi:MAG: DUF1553 domain-containing protein [Fuerstiella sp.]
MAKQFKILYVSGLLAGLMTAAGADEPTAAQLEFFEARIRPILIEHCYECHNSAETAEGGLAVDHRAALLAGGDGGQIVVPGKPGQSRLLAILKHEIEGLEMPDGGAKLDESVIADFERWIAMGAPDPRAQPLSAEELATATSWQAVLERRRQWWSLQPIRAPEPPELPADAFPDRQSGHPVDRFVQQKLHQADLQPAAPADAAILVRRLFFNLAGLPPTGAEASEWISRIDQATPGERKAVVEELVDQLLSRPQFGERWARHWMDWIRYAESHGSEGDPAIDGAWQFRDYLIRALNTDVPVDQLIREQIAGDLLSQPRLNADLGINESAIGPAHWRMVFHGFAPTDALDERVRFTDDQINAFSKAFLGLTVSCARCHDHKFDAISQKDYYALFGILASARPGRRVIDTPDRTDTNQEALRKLKPRIRVAIADDWLQGDRDQGNLRLALSSVPASGKLPAQAEQQDSLLHPLWLADRAVAEQGQVTDVWNRVSELVQQQKRRTHRFHDAKATAAWHLADESDYATWFAEEAGLPESPQRAGEFAVAATGSNALAGIYPAGIYSHSISARRPARLASADVEIGPNQKLWVLARGAGDAALRYVVQDYPRNGTVYPVRNLDDQWQWHPFDLSYWAGDSVHIELATARDAPLLVKGPERSWFAVREAVIQPTDAPAPVASVEHLALLVTAAGATVPGSREALATLYETVIVSAVAAWKNGGATNAQALLLDECLKLGLLPNGLSSLSTAQPLIEEYRRLEQQIPVPTRVPGLDETMRQDQPLFVRGNHKQPGDPVPARFLEAIDATPYAADVNGRLALAEDVLRDDNPLTRRVIVNRIWHHLFGQGIVRTPDNFGRLGDLPSHPELLDWLALKFAREGWSVKRLVRLIVTSETWQQSNIPSSAAGSVAEVDPENRLLSHANVRRLEAEAIRDKLLAVSGKLQHQLGGPPVNGDSPRRSVYVKVIRNNLDPLLRAFDFPEPFSSVGRRDVTNVPAQSLMLMNDRRISDLANGWAAQLLQDDSLATAEARVREMFMAAFGRPAEASEVERSLAWLGGTRARLEHRQQQSALLQQQITDQRQHLQQLKEPVRKRLLAAAAQDKSISQAALPQPLLQWNFDGTDQFPVELHNGAQLVEGALQVSARGYAVTPPLPPTVLSQPLAAKTLEAWVQLDNLNQRGGGVISVQTPDGVLFDAIVFAERDPGQWLAGSNNFARTQPFNAASESEADRRPVHVAIVYGSDGTVTGYRDGEPYGRPYQSNGPLKFTADNTVVSFGVRHLPATGNRLLSGRILKAQLYNSPLSAEEIAASSGSNITYVSDAQVMAALADDVRAGVVQLTEDIAVAESQLAALGSVPDRITDVDVWSELARAMFTFKEFIYVR